MTTDRIDGGAVGCWGWALLLAVMASGCGSPDLPTAVMNNDVNAVRRHIASGTDLDRKILDDDNSALNLAVIFGKDAAAELLLESGADLESVNERGMTPLFNAAFFCRLDLTRLLLDRGAVVQVMNADGFMMTQTMEPEWGPELERVYREASQEIDQTFDPDHIVWTRREIANLLRTKWIDLWNAGQNNRLEVIEQAVAADACVDEKDPIGGNSALNLAAIKGNLEAVKSLLEGGADLESKNNEQATPLSNACFFCQSDVVAFLLEKGADPKVKTKEGLSLIQMMEPEWSQELDGISGFLFAILQMPYDREEIRNTRPEIAATLRRHAGEGVDSVLARG